MSRIVRGAYRNENKLPSINGIILECQFKKVGSCSREGILATHELKFNSKPD